MGKKVFEYVDTVDINKNCSILQVAQDLGVSVYRRGRRYAMLCPNPKHNDRHLGSCFLTDDGKKNSFYCYSCGASGGPIDLVMMLDKCEFVEAANKLGYKYGFVSTKSIDTKYIGWNGLNAKEYEEFGLYNVSVEHPYAMDEYEEPISKYEKCSMQQLAVEDPEIHDQLLISKFYEKIYYLTGFLAMVDRGDFIQYGEAFQSVAEWIKAVGELILRYKRYLERGLIDKDLLDEIFSSSSGDQLMMKAKQHAKEILKKKKCRKILNEKKEKEAVSF